MAWPPTTHQDVQDEVTISRLFHQDYFRPGYYNHGIPNLTSTTSNALAAGTAYIRPFVLFAPRSFDRIGINIVTPSGAGSGGTIAFAIFAPGLGVPGALLHETAAVSSEASPAVATISQSLNAGIHWIGVRVAVAGCSVSTSATVGSVFISPSTAPPSGGTGGFTATGAASAFPSASSYTGTTPFQHFACLRAV